MSGGNDASFLNWKLSHPFWNRTFALKFARLAFFINHFIGYDTHMSKREGHCIGIGRPNITKWPRAVWNRKTSKDVGHSLAVIARLA